jgi:hypothetical protein
MNRSVARSRLACVLMWLVCGSMASGDAVAAAQSVATLEVESALLRWIPNVDAAGIELAIADPAGSVRTIRFPQGAIPALSLFDAAGSPLLDGTYTWELRLRPAPRLGGGAGGAAATAPQVASGYFKILDGSLVDPDGIEESARGIRQRSAPGLVTATDQVVPDDFIVDGKACLGLGCNNNENFGSEALRLKQSVVSLRFEDTSSQATFAARDWQLAANQPGPNGAERFSLDDLNAGTSPVVVRGGAPDNSASPQLGVGAGRGGSS